MIIGFIILITLLSVIGLLISLAAFIGPNASFGEKRHSYEIENFLDTYLIGLLVVTAVGILIIKFI